MNIGYQIPLSNLKLKIPLWKHQLGAVEFAYSKKHIALFMEVGTGKTATAINILRAWNMTVRKPLRTLVLCPQTIIKQWSEEIERHSELGAYVIPLVGTGKKRLATLTNHNVGSPIYITNYETLSMKDVFKELLSQVDCLICDESQYLKNVTALRTKLAIELSDQCSHKIIMSGTPVLKSPMDLFSQFRILDGGETFGKNFFHFRYKYFFDKNAYMPRDRHFPNWQLRPSIEAEITEKIYSKSIRAKKSECLDLPDLVRVEVPVEMSSAQEKVYKQMAREFVTYVNDNDVRVMSMANIALTKLLRLQQIVTGFLVGKEYKEVDELMYSEDKVVDIVDCPRDQAFKDVLSSIDDSHKIIVWCVFKHNQAKIMRILEELKIGAAELHGSMSAKAKEESIKRFKEDGSCRILVANPRAGGVGLNLTEASYSIYYSRGYSLADDIQSEARNYRGGSEVHSKITRIDLYTPNTVDQEIMQAIKNKQDVAEKILAIKSKMEQDACN